MFSEQEAMPEDTGSLTSESFATFEVGSSITNKQKHKRRRHRNSRWGCKECKRRRIKCDETLPECLNCQKKRNKCPEFRCSYLDMNNEELCVFEEMKRHFQSSILLTGGSQEVMTPIHKISPKNHLSSSVPSTSPTINVADSSFEVRLISHKPVNVPKSQFISLFDGVNRVTVLRVFYCQTILHAIQDWSMSSRGFVAMSTYSVMLALKRKIRYINSNIKEHEIKTQKVQQLERDLELLGNIGRKYKVQTLTYMREMIAKVLEDKSLLKDVSVSSTILMASVCLQNMDILTNYDPRDRHYIGGLDFCAEIYKNSKPSEICKTAKCFWDIGIFILSHLSIPAYSAGPLFESLQQLEDFKVHIDEDNTTLLFYYNELVEYLRYVTELLPQQNFDAVSPFPFSKMFEIYQRWITAIPSDALCIVSSMSQVSKVFYSFYYGISYYLDQLFPSMQYIMKYSFLGPGMAYPFSIGDIFDGLVEPLRPFAVFSIRMLSFFEKRSALIRNTIMVVNPLPKDLGEYRFKSRTAGNFKEEQIDFFKSTLIKRENYPRLLSLPDGSWLKSGNGQFYCKDISCKNITNSPLQDSLVDEQECYFGRTQETISHADIIEKLDRLALNLAEEFDPAPSSSLLNYYSSEKFTLNNLGFFHEDYDVTGTYQEQDGFLNLTQPSIEFIEEFKKDRIHLFAGSDKSFSYNN